jgi:hypothetical protein
MEALMSMTNIKYLFLRARTSFEKCIHPLAKPRPSYAKETEMTLPVAVTLLRIHTDR